MKNSAYHQYGFSLLEIAVAMVLTSLLLYGGFDLYINHLKLSKKEQAQQSLLDIKHQMLTFVSVNGFMPCPDIDNDGREDRNGSDNTKACAARFGYLPWRDIGSESTDPWGNPYFYRINMKGTNDDEVHDLCSRTSAGIFGRGGNLTGSELYYCKSNKTFYCTTRTSDLDDPVCPDNQYVQISQRQLTSTPTDVPTLLESGKWPYAPYAGTFSPPVGYFNDGLDDESAYFIRIHNDRWITSSTALNTDPPDDAQYRMALQVQAIVLSFGRNGRQIWHGITDDNGHILDYYDAAYKTFTEQNHCNLPQENTPQNIIELENCDRDNIYIDSRQADDQLIWINTIELKKALMDGEKL